jgi:competence protein ComEC
VAWLALGLLSGAGRSVLPTRSEASPEPSRPVEAVVTVAGHWRSRYGSWSARVTVERLRQRAWVGTWRSAVYLEVPAGDDLPGYGSRLRVQGFLKRPPGFANRTPVRPGAWRISLKSRRLMEAEAPGPWWGRVSSALRRRVDGLWNGPAAHEPGLAVARALAVGDPSLVPADWLRGLRRSGLGHLLAISGLHVGLVAGGPLLIPGLGRASRLALSLAAIGLYLVVVGPRPSLLRASLMAAVGMSALLVHRPPAAANSLAWCLLLFLGGRPGLVEDLGFALTFAAVGGLIALAPILARRWGGGSRSPRRLLAATVAAQVATLPWSVPAFHLINPVAALWNLLAIPWTALTLAVSLLWVTVALFLPGLGRLTVWVLDLVAAPYGWPGLIAPGLSGAFPLVLSASGATLLAAALVTCLLRRCAGLVMLAITVGVVGCPFRSPAREPELVVLDVGQGDAVLLREAGRSVLIDGGGWRGEGVAQRVLLPALVDEGVRRLDVVILSHPDVDHCRGLEEVASFLPVKEVWTAPGWRRSGCAARLLTLPGTRLRVLWSGQDRQVGGWHFKVLNPVPGSRGNDNGRSLVLLASVVGGRVLLTGDIDTAAEHRLMERWGERLRCDVLKVAHHGSSTSSGWPFLEAAGPRLAVISAGRQNPYGHPSEEVMQRLERRRIPILRTDLHGAVHIRFGPSRALHVHLPGSPR